MRLVKLSDEDVDIYDTEEIESRYRRHREASESEELSSLFDDPIFGAMDDDDDVEDEDDEE